ncbi:unnamed protein product, partial [Polarella glacialis]
VVADVVQPDAVGHAEVSPEMPSASAEGEAPPAESRRPAPLESPVPLRDAKRLAWQEVTSPASTAGVTSDTGGATTATATTASGSERSSRGNGRQSPLRSGKLRPVSPRTRMGDILAGQYSPTRYPESCGRPSRMIGVAGNWLPARPASAASFSFTASSRGSGPLRVSRSSPGSPRPGAREALAASNECVAWLKYRQSDAHVEGEIDKMIVREQGLSQQWTASEYRGLREDIHSRSYRDATKSFSSMARRVKSAKLMASSAQAGLLDRCLRTGRPHV